MKRWIIETWKNSCFFRFIDRIISENYRKRLRNSEFTILCSNCIGGVIYHRLGKKFLSPTVNMFFTQPDFVSFCLNLDYYLQQKLHFIQTESNYPVAQLLGDGDIPTITLNFNHSTNKLEAEDAWEKRKKRIRKDNIYVILYKLDGLSIEQALELEKFPCKNKVLLTAEPIPEISWAYYIKPNKRQQYASSYLGKDLFGIRWFEKKWDFVGFLNKG